MKTLHPICFCLSVALLFAVPGSAYAAGTGGGMSGGNKAVTPATKPPPLPTLEKPVSEVKSTFPELPPSRPCVANDTRGLLHLLNVYEDPQGTETSSFRATPNQYLMFRNNNVYARVNMDESDANVSDVVKKLRQHSTGLLQFLVQDNGFIYFYQNSVAVDVQACFVVAVDKVPFKTGQLLLMPPKGQIQGHLVKVYEKIKTPRNNNGPASKGKGRKSRNNK